MSDLTLNVWARPRRHGPGDYPWPQYCDSGPRPRMTQTQYCNLEIFPRHCHPGVTTRDASHILCHMIITAHTWQCTSAVSCHLRTPDDGTICVCFTLWVFSLGFMMSFSKAESQCENICHPERAARLALALFVSTWRLMLKLISKYDILQSSKLKKQVIFGSENYRRLNCFNADRLRLI